MLTNHYEITKYKQSFDNEGNEILTPVDVIKGSKVIKQKNLINELLPLHAVSRDVEITDTVWIDDMRTFDNVRILVTPIKMLTKVPFLNSTHSDYAYDTTYDAADKFIVGAIIDGQQDAVPSGTDIRVLTVRGRFSAPTTNPRVINTILVGQIETHSNSESCALSSVLLDTPCIQLTDEVLVINYRYVIELDAIYQQYRYKDNHPEFFRRSAECLGLFIEEYPATHGQPYGYCFESLPAFNQNNRILADGSWKSFTNDDNSDSLLMVSEGIFEVNLFKDVSDDVGKFLNCITLYKSSGIGDNLTFVSDHRYYPVGEIRLRRPNDTVIQNIFNKQVLSASTDIAVESPFYKAEVVGNSIGDVLFEDDFVSGDTSYATKGGIAELFRVEITTGGTASTAEYKIAKRAFTSFEGASSWKCALQGSFVFAGQNDYHTIRPVDMKMNTNRDQIYGTQFIEYQAGGGGIKPLQLGELVILSRDSHEPNNGLFVHCIDLNRKGYPFRLDTTALPTFLATDITSFCTAEDGTILVSCANTGLWKLKRNLGDLPEDTTVERITIPTLTDDTSCTVVNYGRYGHRFNSNARVAAIFGNELAISDDGGVTWNIYNAGTTPAFDITQIAETINGICVHPDHDEVLIAATPTLFTYELGINLSSDVQHNVYHWKASTGTFTVENLNTQYANYAHTHGALNGMMYPISNAGTFKWGIKRWYSSTPRLYLFNDVTELTSNSYLSKLDFECIYDQDIDDTLIFGLLDGVNGHDGMYVDTATSHGTNTLQYLEANALSNYYSDKPTRHFAVGRGVFLATGALEVNLPPNNIYLSSSEYTDSYCRFRLMHLSFEQGGTFSADYYKNNNLNFWFKYGWNGSEWELDHPDSKVASASSEDLIDGLKLRFVSDSFAPSDPNNFITTEIWDTFAYDGIVKDDYTAFNMTAASSYGLSEVLENDFTPNVVPATGFGNGRRPISVEFWNGHTGINSVGNYEDDYGNLIIYSDSYIASSPVGRYNAALPAHKNFTPIGPVIPNSVDFTLEFKMSFVIHEDFAEVYETASREHPQIILCTHSDATENSTGLYLFGIRIQVSPANPEDYVLVIYSRSSGVLEKSYTTIVNADPKNDVYTFEKDVTEGTFRFLRNGELIRELTYATYDQELRLNYLGKGYFPLTEISSSYVSGWITEIFDMFLTYNDQRLISKIGNGVDTGVWANNYGRLGMYEYIKGLRKIYLDGVEAAIVHSNLVDVPPAGSVKINAGTGELVFNPADAGKVITGSARYLLSANKRA